MTHHDNRYAVYGFYKTKVLPKTPELLYAKAIAGHDTRQALKKLSSEALQVGEEKRHEECDISCYVCCRVV